MYVYKLLYKDGIWDIHDKILQSEFSYYGNMLGGYYESKLDNFHYFDSNYSNMWSEPFVDAVEEFNLTYERNKTIDKILK